MLFGWDNVARIWIDRSSVNDRALAECALDLIVCEDTGCGLVSYSGVHDVYVLYTT